MDKYSSSGEREEQRNSDSGRGRKGGLERGVLRADRDGVICGGLTVGKSARCRVSGEPKSLVNLEGWSREWHGPVEKEVGEEVGGREGCFQPNIPQSTWTSEGKRHSARQIWRKGFAEMSQHSSGSSCRCVKAQPWIIKMQMNADFRSRPTPTAGRSGSSFWMQTQNKNDQMLTWGKSPFA